MKIGFISTVGGYSWAGSEELWYRTALLALQKGNRVEALIAREMMQSEEVKKLMVAGGVVRPRRNSFHPRLASFVESVHSSYKNFLARQDVVLLSLGALPDVLYLPGLLNTLMQSKTKVICLCQFNSDLLQFRSFQRERVRRLLEKSTALVFVSKSNLQLAERQFAVHFKNAYVVYNPIKVHADELLPFPSGDSVQFGCVARFDTLWKGHDVLLEVLNGRQWKARNWHLNLYGSGPDVYYVYDLIKAYGMENRVTHHGHVKDIRAVWQHNHLMVLPSRGEGTPLAVLEAMMCSRPVVTTDVGGNREIIQDGINGWLAEASTSFSFGATLERAWQQRQRWNEFGKEAFISANRFSQMDPVATLLGLLTNL